MTFNPNANLLADTRYTVRLTNGIRDTAGNAMVAVSWSFLTGPAPTVGPTAPVNQRHNGAVGSNVTATFNENMVATTINGTNVTLRQGTLAPGTGGGGRELQRGDQGGDPEPQCQPGGGYQVHGADHRRH